MTGNDKTVGHSNFIDVAVLVLLWITPDWVGPRSSIGALKVSVGPVFWGR